MKQQAIRSSKAPTRLMPHSEPGQYHCPGFLILRLIFLVPAWCLDDRILFFVSHKLFPKPKDENEQSDPSITMKSYLHLATSLVLSLSLYADNLPAFTSMDRIVRGSVSTSENVRQMHDGLTITTVRHTQRKAVVEEWETITEHRCTWERQSIWIDHNIQQAGCEGMVFHVRLSTHGLRGKKCELNAYISRLDGAPLTDVDGKYCTKNGKISAGTNIEPGHDHAEFADVSWFLPYAQLHLNKPTTVPHQLRCHFELFVDSVPVPSLTKTEPLTFTYSPCSYPTSYVVVTYVTSDHGVLQNGRKGMLLKLCAELHGTAAQAGHLRGWFYHEEGNGKLVDRRGSGPRATDGQVCTKAVNFTGNGDGSVFTRDAPLTVFVPYTDLPHVKSKTPLTIEFSATNASGGKLAVFGAGASGINLLPE